ncbi:MAG: RNA methyltransferase [Promethearchaeota archaeon]
MNKKRIFRAKESFQETHLSNNYKNLSFTIILVQPESAGNIGSIARVMKNFNFKKLVIFNPIEQIENIKNHETQGFAMHGKDILLNADIIKVDKQENHYFELTNYLKNYDLIIASTAKGMKYSNVPRLTIFPEDLTIPISKNDLNIAILFGKESRGLTNEEIALADILIRIPTWNEYPTMNLSHASAIILYEIFKKIYILNVGRGKKPILLADKKDRLIIYKFIQEIISKLKIRSYREKNVYFAFKNIFERSLMSKKELSLIMGVFSKLNSILKDINLYSE